MIPLVQDGLIKIIYHISDIHIRTTDERYEEYNIIFQKFCNDITDPGSSLIVITGDILHSKTQLTPLCIKELIDFLIMLTNKTDVIIVLGNHDLPANNIIGDNIINIIAQKNFDTQHNLFILTQNDTYIYKNIIFGNTLVYSTYVTPCNEETTNKIKIALYHGTIYEAKMNDANTCTESALKISDFEDYDMGLFGDVHVQQYMDAKKRFAYSGSMIQQNFGEDIDNHGYIKWDIIKKRSHFVPIHNDYGYVTFRIKSISEIVFPNIKKLRARLICTDMTQQDVSLIEIEFRKRYELLEFIVSRENTIISSSPSDVSELDQQSMDKTSEQLQQFSSLTKDSDIIQMFKEVITKVYPTYNKTESLLKFVNDELQELGHSFNNDYKRISLNSLKFNNLFAYGSGNKINFNNMSGIVGLVAPNFSGKSSIIDAILFSLYEKSSRGIRTQCVNITKDRFSSEIDLDVNGDQYNVIRTGNRQDSKSTVAKVNITKNSKMIECDDKLHYNNFVSDKICQYDKLLDISFVLQASNGFIDKTDEERKKILFQVMNLDIFHKLYKKIKVNVSQTKFYITKMKKELVSMTSEFENINAEELAVKQQSMISELETLRQDKDMLEHSWTSIQLSSTCNDEQYTEDEYLSTKEKYSEICQKILTYKESYEFLQTRLDNINFKLSRFIPSEVDEIYRQFSEQKDNEIMVLRRYLQVLNVSLDDDDTTEFDSDYYLSKLEKLDNLIFDVQEKIQQYPVDISTTIDGLKFSSDELQIQINERQKLTNELEELEQKQEKLKDHKYNPNCEFCIKNSLTLEKEFVNNKISEVAMKLDMMNSIIEKLYEDYLICKDNMKLLVQYDNDMREYDRLICKRWKINKLFEKLTTLKELSIIKKRRCTEYDEYNALSISQIEVEKKKIICENDLLQMKNKKRDLEEVIKSYEEFLINKKDYDIRENLRISLQAVNKKIKITEAQLFEIETKFASVKHSQNLQQKYNQQIDDAEQTLIQYNMLLDVYKKHGIIDKILCEKVVPELELGVNDLLRTVTNFQVRIRYSDSGLMIERYIGEKYISAKLLSGFEHDILNLIFKIKINQMNVFVKTDFLILDEILSSADEIHLNQLENLFEYIKEHYKWCLLITHLGTMKNYLTQTISIVQKEGLSKIVVK